MIYRNVDLPRPDAVKQLKGELRETGQMLVKVVFFLLVLAVSLDRMAYWLVPQTPFGWEVKLADLIGLGDSFGAGKTKQSHAALNGYLQARADTIINAMQVEDEINIQVHYIDDELINAFATLGGHIFVCRGILQKIRFEEELDALLAHEIGHVKSRHVAGHASRALGVVGVLSLMGINSSGMYRWILQDVINIAMLSHSRDAEADADQFAKTVSLALHGHTQGLVGLFEMMAADEGNPFAPEWTRSHPDTPARAQLANDGTSIENNSIVDSAGAPLRTLHWPQPF